MNFDAVFDVSEPTFHDNVIYFSLYELKGPIPFSPHKETLSDGAAIITQSYLYNGKYLNRIEYFNKVPHCTLRYCEHQYKVEVSEKPDNLNDFVKDYIPLIIKYKILSSRTECSYRHKGTKEPVPEDEANRLFLESIQSFRTEYNI